jgi:hypothetical protein
VIVRLEQLHGAILDQAMQERLLLDEGERAIAQLIQNKAPVDKTPLIPLR